MRALERLRDERGNSHGDSAGRTIASHEAQRALFDNESGRVVSIGEYRLDRRRWLVQGCTLRTAEGFATRAKVHCTFRCEL